MEHFGRKQEQEKEKGDNEAEAEWEEEAGGGGESTALFEMEATQPSIGESDTSSTGGSRWSTRRIRPREGSSGASTRRRRSEPPLPSSFTGAAASSSPQAEYHLLRPASPSNPVPLPSLGEGGGGEGGGEREKWYLDPTESLLRGSESMDSSRRLSSDRRGGRGGIRQQRLRNVLRGGR